MKRRKVDLLVFCGGDGTARDIFRSVGPNLPVLGVPAGVKVYSSVFAISPRAAAESTLQFLNRTISTKPGEVLDIDEKNTARHTLSRVEQPIDVVGHDVGALLTMRVASAFDVPLRSWAVDVANIFHPRFAWPERVHKLQTRGVGEEMPQPEISRTTAAVGSSRVHRLGLVREEG